MRLLLFLLIICSNLNAQDTTKHKVLFQSQDTVRLKHRNYTSVFSKSLLYPVIDFWWVTRIKTSAKHLPRKDQFQKDPLLPMYTDLGNDYKSSGYDRGHLSPANDNETQGDTVLTECFYFSNMMAQPHSLNAGDWKSVETMTDGISAKYDSVLVIAGGIGVSKKIGRVSVPKQCWKVLFIKRTLEFECFLFDNSVGVEQTGVNSHKIDITDLEELTGFKFESMVGMKVK